MCFHNQSKPEVLYLYTSEALTEARSMNSVHLQQARSRALSVHLLICLPAAPPSGPFPAVVFRRPFRKASPGESRKAEHDLSVNVACGFTGLGFQCEPRVPPLFFPIPCLVSLSPSLPGLHARFASYAAACERAP